MVRPSDHAVKKFEQQLATFILNFKGLQKTLIEHLNRKLGGWANYRCITGAYDAFRKIDTSIQALLAKKMLLLHPKRKWKTSWDTCWITVQGGSHIFALRDNKTVQVARLAEFDITSYKPVRTSFHLYRRCATERQTVIRTVWRSVLSFLTELPGA